MNATGFMVSLLQNGCGQATSAETALWLPFYYRKGIQFRCDSELVRSTTRFRFPDSFVKKNSSSAQQVSCKKMDHDKTGCQAPPEGPILCINNCGFFGSAATMNMCSKCHKDILLKQEQAKLAASSIGNIMNGSSSSTEKEPVVAAAANIDIPVIPVEPKTVSVQPLFGSGPEGSVEAKPKDGPKRCSSCNKRVGLTGFNCRCGDLFCAVHRYSDKHNCPFDYRTAAQDAIAKANPVVKAEKLDKI
ncbi:Zinc finger A20 and AN1 domain-containing stress-associated protein 8 [Glycine soja]